MAVGIPLTAIAYNPSLDCRFCIFERWMPCRIPDKAHLHDMPSCCLRSFSSPHWLDAETRVQGRAAQICWRRPPRRRKPETIRTIAPARRPPQPRAPRHQPRPLHQRPRQARMPKKRAHRHPPLRLPRLRTISTRTGRKLETPQPRAMISPICRRPPTPKLRKAAQRLRRMRPPRQGPRARRTGRLRPRTGRKAPAARRRALLRRRAMRSQRAVRRNRAALQRVPTGMQARETRALRAARAGPTRKPWLKA